MEISRRRFIVSSAVVGGGLAIGYAATRPSGHRITNDTLAQGSARYLTSFLKIDPNAGNRLREPLRDGSGQSHRTGHDGSRRAGCRLGTGQDRTGTGNRFVRNRRHGYRLRRRIWRPPFLMPLIEASAMKIAQIGNLQTTGGSASIRFTGQLGMRVAGAAAREMLLQCAAERWGVPTGECTTALSYVHHNARDNHQVTVNWQKRRPAGTA